MSARLLGIGTSAPARSLAQADAAAMAARLCAETPEQTRMLERLYSRTGVKSRGSVLLGLNGERRDPDRFYARSSAGAQRGPTTGERVLEYSRAAAPLALDASTVALRSAGVRPREVTHVVTASCTGFAAPGVDADLIRMLGLPQSTQRTHVGFMGCHAAVNALRVAKAIAESDAPARVLVCCVEVCTVHLQYGWEMGRVVANSLFADGAGAAVVAASDDGGFPAGATGFSGACA